MPEKAKSIYDEYSPLLIRKAQKAISAKGDVANEETVRAWLYKNYPKKRESPERTLNKYGVPQ